MSLATSFNLEDEDGGIWAVSVNSEGLLVTTGASGPASSPVFRDANGLGTKFRLGVNTAGLLTVDSVAASVEPSVNFLRLWDPDGNQHMVCIDSDMNLMTTTNCMPPFGPTYAVGSLLPQGGGYAACVQPGGAGTPVTDPVQTQGEQTGMFHSGCGHSITSWRVQIFADGGCPTAFVTCPICSWLARKITPASDLYNQANSILFA